MGHEVRRLAGGGVRGPRPRRRLGGRHARHNRRGGGRHDRPRARLRTGRRRSLAHRCGQARAGLGVRERVRPDGPRVGSTARSGHARRAIREDVQLRHAFRRIRHASVEGRCARRPARGADARRRDGLSVGVRFSRRRQVLRRDAGRSRRSTYVHRREALQRDRVRQRRHIALRLLSLGRAGSARREREGRRRGENSRRDDYDEHICRERLRRPHGNRAPRAERERPRRGLCADAPRRVRQPQQRERHHFRPLRPRHAFNPNQRHAQLSGHD